MNKKLKSVINKNKYRSQFYHQHKKKLNQRKTKPNLQKKDSSKKLISFSNKVLISICVFLVLLISKNDQKFKVLYEQTFKNMNFVKIQSFVTGKLTGIFPATNNPNKFVGSIIIDLSDTQNYRDGVIVETDYSAPVESCVDGIVIRIYNDDDLGKVFVIQDIFGREYSYGYLEDSDLKLYNNVEYGDILGVGKLTEDMNGEYYLAIKDGNDNLNVIQVVNDEN